MRSVAIAERHGIGLRRLRAGAAETLKASERRYGGSDRRPGSELHDRAILPKRVCALTEILRLVAGSVNLELPSGLAFRFSIVNARAARPVSETAAIAEPALRNEAASIETSWLFPQPAPARSGNVQAMAARCPRSSDSIAAA